MPINPLPNSPATLDTDSMRNKINELIGNNASVTVSNSPPTGPAEGDLWFDEGSAAMYVYVAAPTNAWIQTNPASTSGSGGGGMTYSGATGQFSRSLGTPVSTTLDISNEVGTNRALVYMRVYGGSHSMWMNFAIGGSASITGNYGLTGCASVYVTSGPFGAGGGSSIITTTNAQGVLSVYALNTITNVNYEIVAYQVIS